MSPNLSLIITPTTLSLTKLVAFCLAELAIEWTGQTGRTGSCARRPNVSTRSETNWPRIRRHDGRRRRFGDHWLAFYLRPQATQRSSSLALSTVVTSDSWPVCLTSSLCTSARAAYLCGLSGSLFWATSAKQRTNQHVIVCARFHLYRPSSFLVADPQKLAVPSDLKGDLYNSCYSSTELCCDYRLARR